MDMEKAVGILKEIRTCFIVEENVTAITFAINTMQQQAEEIRKLKRQLDEAMLWR